MDAVSRLLVDLSDLYGRRLASKSTMIIVSAGIIITLLILCQSVMGQESALDSAKFSLFNERFAVKKAAEYLGIESDSVEIDIQIKSSLIREYNEENIPFLDQVLDQKLVWRIMIPDVTIGQQSIRPRKRDFEVDIDANTSRLLRIYSLSTEVGSSDTLPQPSARGAEINAARRGIVFHGLPKDIPSTPFIEALKAVIIGNPASTKLIYAYYWDIETRGGDMPNLWIITLHGMSSPVHSPGSGGENIPVNQRNSFMSLIDAVSGRLICSETSLRDDTALIKEK